jgi:hypothetical protein
MDRKMENDSFILRADNDDVAVQTLNAPRQIL